MPDLITRVARRWVARQLSLPPSTSRQPRTPTQMQLDELSLPVTDERFLRAMSMAARHMGGTFDLATSTIRLPRHVVRPGDRSFPNEMQVLYRKFPCGMILPGAARDQAEAGYPCVSFDLIPKVPGDPRRSRVFRSFTGPASQAKTLFGKFLGWLKIIAKAVHRYTETSNQGEPSALRVAARWLAKR
jgi:hypothetical protein